MAKIYGLFGSMTGKVADVVMSVRNGEQIARKYQPVVYNPSTPAQVEARAKLKALSQLSAVLAPAIAMNRVGAVSARNRFLKKNYQLAVYANNAASINMVDVQLTSSVVAMPALNLSRQSGAALELAIVPSSAKPFDRVIYAVIQQDGDEYRLRGINVVSEAGTNNTFALTVDIDTAAVTGVVLAYGVRDNTEYAKTMYGNIETGDTAGYVELITQRLLTENDVTLTETKGAIIPAAPGA